MRVKAHRNNNAQNVKPQSSEIKKSHDKKKQVMRNFHDSIFYKFINVPSLSKIIPIIINDKCKERYKNISIKQPIFFTEQP